MTTREIAEGVAAHADANYEKGWDPIAECYSQEEIEKEIDRSGARTVEAAIAWFADCLDLRAEVGNDVRAAGDNPYRQTENAAR